MNILLTITEIVMLDPLKPYILHLLVHFLALKTKNFSNGSFKTPKMAYISKITTCSGYIWICRTFKLICYSKCLKS